MSTRKKFVEYRFKNAYERKIIQSCFGDESIANFSLGLKMVFALNDPPLFVKLKEVGEQSQASP